ncbi:Zinc finger C2H2-type,Zinc finger, SWIM-type [Cinara cedri]|uniref:Zinc finger C2H2-type,Zinc finger, SWIM-type n=1 Tax=Cinara cedri TaxID=506608 RepID=A0A5E4MXX7_9HEMI|nr:Zinc finger C2H2-type,Zinc finger, SWIM-type [Cinara cedri]
MSKNEHFTYFCVCGQAYKNKSLVRKHVSVCKYVQNQYNLDVNYPVKEDLLQLSNIKCETQSVNHNQSTYKDQKIERFKCGCEKRFKSKGGYYRHIKKCKLRPEHQVVTGKTKCNEPECLLTFKYIRDFRQHLTEKHEIQFDVEDKKFNKYTEFLRWKENYETKTCSCYYHRKTETRSGRKVEYWYCNRSGMYQSSAHSRRRKLKSQGILKINNNCTSSMTLTINEIEDTVQARIYHTHYGHEAELIHLRIPKTDKQEIASKLLEGVKIEDILLMYKGDGSSKPLERKHLIKRRDILNISRKYNVKILLPKLRQTSKNKYELIQKMIETSPNVSLYTLENNKRHIVASQLSLSLVHPIYENAWKISMGNNSSTTSSFNIYNEYIYHVTKNKLSCNENCTSYSCCNICYHSYSCTCNDFLSKKIICEHIHLVVLYQATPQTYQCEDNKDKCLHFNTDHTSYTQKSIKSSSLTRSTENVHLSKDITENIDYTFNKQNRKSEKLKNLKSRVEKIVLETLQKVNECSNCDLLENIEKQMTNIACNLNTDLIERKTKSNEMKTIVPEKNIEMYYVY